MKQQSIAFGYVHQFDDMISYPVPCVLISLIKSFYDDYIYFSFEGGRKMWEFHQVQNGEALYSEPVKIGDITFQLSVCPDGWCCDSKGSVQFYLELMHLPDYIDDISVYIALKCETIPKRLRIFKCWKDAPRAVGCGKSHLKKSQFKDKKSVHFIAKIQIKDITFNDANNNKHKYCLPVLIFKKQSSYSWDISGSRMRRLLRGKSVHSPIYDDVWAIAGGEMSKGLFTLNLGCFAYPRGIKSMTVRFELKCDGENIVFPFVKKEELIDCLRDEKTYANMATISMDVLRDALGDRKSITLSIDLKIVICVADDGRVIDASQFSKYNIL